ncbi:MAG: hypothetical protein HFJ09_04480 [Lachnospiraceae bacterium]|nr:hypothetical protein [Lachnospiraceae bacterium]
MRLFNNRIRKYIGRSQVAEYDERNLQETIQRSKEAFFKNEEKQLLSGTEFIFQQGKYIHKRWWVLQGGVLLLLWGILQVTEQSFYIQRSMGIAASLFATLILPEMWKNKNSNAIEVECITYFSLHQIYAARIFLFALVDLLLLSVFSFFTILTGKLLLEDMLIQFLLPYVVACSICFRCLYSRLGGNEIFAVFLCVVWTAIWTQIVLSEKIYACISPLVWVSMLVVAVLYLGNCICKGQKNCKEIWEEK